MSNISNPFQLIFSVIKYGVTIVESCSTLFGRLKNMLTDSDLKRFITISVSYFLKLFPNKNTSLRKTRLSTWIHKFLDGEEKAAILIDYRIEWYGENHLNKWIRFKVWLKTLHYIFYEVWFKERLDSIKSFQVRMPRW